LETSRKGILNVARTDGDFNPLHFLIFVRSKRLSGPGWRRRSSELQTRFFGNYETLAAPRSSPYVSQVS